MDTFNFFSKNKKDSTSDSIKRLSEENERMMLQIDGMISKINSLEVKTRELRRIIEELENQKKQLTETIEKLEDLHKQKEDLIQIAAHDLKNPAGTIKNLVGLLESFDLTNNEQQEIYQGLINISNRIVANVDDVVESVKRSDDLFELHISKNDFNKVVEAVVSRYKAIAINKSITLSSKLEPGIPEFEFDWTKIDEVIENLINNAIKFTPAKCKVEVVSRMERNFVVLEVTDNGPGLTEKEVRMAFNKDVKLSNSPTGGESSTGLGLWIVRKFVENHKGRVWIKSKKGYGSTFAFKIPIDLKSSLKK